MPILHAVTSETFSPNAIGVGAIDALPTFAPTPMALGLNVKCLIHGRVKSNGTVNHSDYVVTISGATMRPIKSSSSLSNTSMSAL